VTLRELTGGLLLFGAAIPAAQADTLIITREGSRMTGDDSEVPETLHRATDGEAKTITFWSRADRMARMDDNGKMIGDLESGVTYLVNDRNRTCYALPTREKASGDAPAAPVEVRETGESRQIGSWQAKGYELKVAADNPIEVAVWVSDDVAVDMSAQRAYTETVVTPDTAWLLALFDLGGYPVRQEFSMGSMQMWSELVSVDEKAAPAGTYEIPAGYSGCD
jgi:hypothetical protein